MAFARLSNLKRSSQVERHEPDRSEFSRYLFPMEGTGAGIGKKGKRKSSSKADASLATKHRQFYGHYDVYCAWDQDQTELDTSTFNPQVGYTRLQLTRLNMKETAMKPGTAGLVRTPGEGEKRRKTVTQQWLRARETTAKQNPIWPSAKSDEPWSQFASEDAAALLNIEELVEWAAALRPRSVHDFKPLLVLTQGLLQDLLAHRLRTFHTDLVQTQDFLLQREHHHQDKQYQMDEVLRSALAKVEASMMLGSSQIDVSVAQEALSSAAEECQRACENTAEQLGVLRGSADVKEGVEAARAALLEPLRAAQESTDHLAQAHQAELAEVKAEHMLKVAQLKEKLDVQMMDWSSDLRKLTSAQEQLESADAELAECKARVESLESQLAGMVREQHQLPSKSASFSGKLPRMGSPVKLPRGASPLKHPAALPTTPEVGGMLPKPRSLRQESVSALLHKSGPLPALKPSGGAPRTSTADRPASTGVVRFKDTDPESLGSAQELIEYQKEQIRKLEAIVSANLRAELAATQAQGGSADDEAVERLRREKAALTDSLAQAQHQIAQLKSEVAGLTGQPLTEDLPHETSEPLLDAMDGDCAGDTDAPTTTVYADAPITLMDADAPATTMHTNVPATTLHADAAPTTMGTDDPAATEHADARATPTEADSSILTKDADTLGTAMDADAPATTMHAELPSSSMDADTSATTMDTDTLTAVMDTDTLTAAMDTDAPSTATIDVPAIDIATTSILGVPEDPDAAQLIDIDPAEIVDSVVDAIVEEAASEVDDVDNGSTLATSTSETDPRLPWDRHGNVKISPRVRVDVHGNFEPEVEVSTAVETSRVVDTADAFSLQVERLSGPKEGDVELDLHAADQIMDDLLEEVLSDEDLMGL